MHYLDQSGYEFHESHFVWSASANNYINPIDEVHPSETDNNKYLLPKYQITDNSLQAQTDLLYDNRTVGNSLVSTYQPAGTSYVVNKSHSQSQVQSMDGISCKDTDSANLLSQSLTAINVIQLPTTPSKGSSSINCSGSSGETNGQFHEKPATSVGRSSMATNIQSTFSNSTYSLSACKLPTDGQIATTNSDIIVQDKHLFCSTTGQSSIETSTATRTAVARYGRDSSSGNSSGNNNHHHQENCFPLNGESHLNANIVGGNVSQQQQQHRLQAYPNNNNGNLSGNFMGYPNVSTYERSIGDANQINHSSEGAHGGEHAYYSHVQACGQSAIMGDQVGVFGLNQIQALPLVAPAPVQLNVNNNNGVLNSNTIATFEHHSSSSPIKFSSSSSSASSSSSTSASTSTSSLSSNSNQTSNNYSFEQNCHTNDGGRGRNRSQSSRNARTNDWPLVGATNISNSLSSSSSTAGASTSGGLRSAKSSEFLQNNETTSQQYAQHPVTDPTTNNNNGNNNHDTDHYQSQLQATNASMGASLSMKYLRHDDSNVNGSSFSMQHSRHQPPLGVDEPDYMFPPPSLAPRTGGLDSSASSHQPTENHQHVLYQSGFNQVPTQFPITY